MKVTLVLYCSETAEFACKTIDRPHILQERMFIAFAKLMLRVEKIVWAEDLEETVICCGLILKVKDGPHEGARLAFPFGKTPQDFWKPATYDGWKIHTADTQWDSLLAPLINIVEVDGNAENFTGE